MFVYIFSIAFQDDVIHELDKNKFAKRVKYLNDGLRKIVVNSKLFFSQCQIVPQNKASHKSNLCLLKENKKITKERKKRSSFVKAQDIITTILFKFSIPDFVQM